MEYELIGQFEDDVLFFRVHKFLYAFVNIKKADVLLRNSWLSMAMNLELTSVGGKNPHKAYALDILKDFKEEKSEEYLQMLQNCKDYARAHARSLREIEKTQREMIEEFVKKMNDDMKDEG